MELLCLCASSVAGTGFLSSKFPRDDRSPVFDWWSRPSGAVLADCNGCVYLCKYVRQRIAYIGPVALAASQSSTKQALYRQPPTQHRNDRSCHITISSSHANVLRNIYRVFDSAGIARFASSGYDYSTSSTTGLSGCDSSHAVKSWVRQVVICREAGCREAKRPDSSNYERSDYSMRGI